LQVTDKLITFVEYLRNVQSVLLLHLHVLSFFPGTLARTISVNCPVSYSHIVSVDFCAILYND